MLSNTSARLSQPAGPAMWIVGIPGCQITPSCQISGQKQPISAAVQQRIPS